MKTQYSDKNGNTQVSDCDTTTQIQIGFSWKWAILVAACAFLVGAAFHYKDGWIASCALLTCAIVWHEFRQRWYQDFIKRRKNRDL